jgi:hypothetical protein
MIKYRGLTPQVIASERFHRLFVVVATEIAARKDVTVEQQGAISELLALARANLDREGGVAGAPFFGRYTKQAVVVMMLLFAVSWLIRLYLFTADVPK